MHLCQTKIIFKTLHQPLKPLKSPPTQLQHANNLQALRSVQVSAWFILLGGQVTTRLVVKVLRELKIDTGYNNMILDNLLVIFVLQVHHHKEDVSGNQLEDVTYNPLDSDHNPTVPTKSILLT